MSNDQASDQANDQAFARGTAVAWALASGGCLLGWAATRADGWVIASLVPAFGFGLVAMLAFMRRALREPAPGRRRPADEPALGYGRAGGWALLTLVGVATIAAPVASRGTGDTVGDWALGGLLVGLGQLLGWLCGILSGLVVVPVLTIASAAYGVVRGRLSIGAAALRTAVAVFFLDIVVLAVLLTLALDVTHGRSVLNLLPLVGVVPPGVRVVSEPWLWAARASALVYPLMFVGLGLVARRGAPDNVG
ncbi:MAG TPA: hypothetical protein VGJ41_12140 [Nocardioides sp.]